MLSKVAMDDGSVDVSEVHELVSWVDDPPGTWLEVSWVDDPPGTWWEVSWVDDPPVTWLKKSRTVFTLLSVPLMRLSGSSSLMRHAIEAIREALREVIREAISGTISGNQKQLARTSRRRPCPTPCRGPCDSEGRRPCGE